MLFVPFSTDFTLTFGIRLPFFHTILFDISSFSLFLWFTRLLARNFFILSHFTCKFSLIDNFPSGWFPIIYLQNFREFSMFPTFFNVFQLSDKNLPFFTNPIIGNNNKTLLCFFFVCSFLFPTCLGERDGRLFKHNFFSFTTTNSINATLLVATFTVLREHFVGSIEYVEWKCWEGFLKFNFVGFLCCGSDYLTIILVLTALAYSSLCTRFFAIMDCW